MSWRRRWAKGNLAYCSSYDYLISELRGAQVSTGMWLLLTMNVSVLPLLKLEQWQTVFDIVAVGADIGGFASIKSFEVSAVP